MFAFIKSELYQHISIAVLLLTPQGLFNILDIYTAYIIRAHMYMYMTLYMYIYMYIVHVHVHRHSSLHASSPAVCGPSGPVMNEYQNKTIFNITVKIFIKSPLSNNL